MTDPGPGEVAAALDATGYVYSDPVTDPRWPDIVSAAVPDVFPPGWGDVPTARDRAAID